MSKAHSNIRLLLVEDNSTNREVAFRILQHLGYDSVEAAEDGQQALDALAAKDFDLVLLDCHLPDMDGYETARRIRRRDTAVRNHDIPIVATTAAAMESDRRKCLEAGMNGYIAKPLRFAALQQAIETWTGGAAAGSAADPVSAPQQKTAVFDGRAFGDLVMGNQGLARRIIRNFVDDMPRQIALLAQALSDGDAPQVRLKAHSIKGAAASVCGLEIRDAASKLEHQGREGNLTEAEQSMRELCTSFERARPVMETFSREKPEEA